MGGWEQLPQPGGGLPEWPQWRKKQADEAGGWAWECQASSQVAMATETKRGAEERAQPPTAPREAQPLSRTCLTRLQAIGQPHFQEERPVDQDLSGCTGWKGPVKIVAQARSAKRMLAEHPDPAANPKYLTCLGLNFFIHLKGRRSPSLS